MIRSRRSTIGVGLDARWITAAQCARRAGRMRLERGVVLSRPDPEAPIGEADLMRLASVLDRRGFTGADLSLVAPDDAVMSAVLELPPRSSGAPVERLARVEVARMHGMAEDSLALGAWDLPPAARARAGSETAVLAMACPHERGDHLASLVWAAGCELAAIDARCGVLARACRPGLPGGDEQVAILDFGWNTAELVIMHRGVVVYERALTRGGIGRFRAALVGQFDLQPDVAEDALACIGLGAGEHAEAWDAGGETREVVREQASHLIEQIGTALGYAAHRYDAERARRLVLTGGWNAIEGIDATLSEELSIETTVLTPGACVEASGEAIGADPRLIPALGAAMRFDD